jgi:CRISPR-associated DxTHG motif protein
MESVTIGPHIASVACRMANIRGNASRSTVQDPGMTHSIRFLPLLAGVALLAACVGAPYPPPPAPMAEVLPKPPVSAEPLRWRPGHWNWTGNGYVWTAGEYVPHAGTSTHWVEGYWTQRGGGWVWVPPGWSR